MKMWVGEGREIWLTDVFNAICIKTDQGAFGIAMRDCGIEVVLDGKMVFQSHDVLPCKSCAAVAGDCEEGHYRRYCPEPSCGRWWWGPVEDTRPRRCTCGARMVILAPLTIPRAPALIAAVPVRERCVLDLRYADGFLGRGNTISC